MAQALTECNHDMRMADEYYRRAISAAPDSITVNNAYLHHLVRSGEVELARYVFRDFFLRSGRQLPSRRGKRMWDGSNIEGSRIFISGTVGYGDCLQFARFASYLKALGAFITLQCPEPLWELISSIEAIDRLVADLESAPEFDFFVSMWTVFLYFSDSLRLAAESVPYLRAGPEITRKWAANFSGHNVLKVGIVWKCSVKTRNKYTDRNLDLDECDSLSEIPGVCYYGLQVPGLKPSERHKIRIVALPDSIIEFVETAGVIESLDLVLTVDTAIAHIAGALNKRTLLLLPFSSDVRWMMDRADSPWYPSITLIRQPQPGDWRSVIAQAAYKIRELASVRSRGQAVVAPVLRTRGDIAGL
jgi:hypothetical protein